VTISIIICYVSQLSFIKNNNLGIFINKTINYTLYDSHQYFSIVINIHFIFLIIIMFIYFSKKHFLNIIIGILILCLDHMPNIIALNQQLFTIMTKDHLNFGLGLCMFANRLTLRLKLIHKSNTKCSIE